MKIYIHSTAPWSPSSYSVLVKRSVPQMVRDGQEVVLGTWYGLQGEPLPWTVSNSGGKSVLVMPSGVGDTYATNMMLPNYRFHKAEVCITISDVWIYPPDITGRMNFAPWLPIDHDPAPEPVIKALETAIYPMAMSKFGVDTLARAGIKAKYVPGSAPANLFKPQDKQAARAKFAFPADCDFLAVMVSANKDPYDRKGFAEALIAFAKFRQSHPSAYLYIHTNWQGAINIPALVESLDIADYVLQPDPYAIMAGMHNDDYMVGVYNSADVLLNPCKSEGFGLPLVEAQMCGCPVAVTDFATTDELLFAGWKIDGQPDWTNGQNSWRKRVHIDSVIDALQAAYGAKDSDKLRKKARKGATRYDTDAVYNLYWRPALKEIEALVNG